MSLRATIRRSLVQFRTNPLRTLLTLLGVVFGVAAVVAMVSIGEGAQRQIVATIEAMGATSVHVHARDVPENKLGDLIRDSVGLSRADARALAAAIPQAEQVAWRKRHPLGVTDLPLAPQEIHVFGVSPGIFATHNLRVGRGRSLHPVDHRMLQRAAVIGWELADAAFPDGQAVGQTIRLEDAYFHVVGVLDHGGAPRARGEGGEGDAAGGAVRGPVAGQGQSGAGQGLGLTGYARSVLIPHETMLVELAPAPIYGEIDTISVQVGSTEQTLPAKDAVVRLLEDLHGGRRDFDVVAPEEVLRQKEATQAVFNMVLIAIAAISLVVGGIGVMNIMLANIMERVSEIGLRRALGARRRDIRNQFLFEAVIICVIGGLVGIALGFTVSWIVSKMVGLPIAFAWESMIVSFGISLLIGVVFGLMPALRAANVNPIEALRGD